MRPGTPASERTHSSDPTSNEWLGSQCDLHSGYEREEDIYRLGGMIFIVFVFLVEVEQEGEEAPLCSMCCYICTACVPLVPLVYRFFCT